MIESRPPLEDVVVLLAPFLMLHAHGNIVTKNAGDGRGIAPIRRLINSQVSP